jgi:hypothetical protein
MKKARYAPRQLLGLCLIVLSLQGAAMSQLRSAESGLDALKSDMVDRRIERADIFFMPYEQTTRTRVTPDMLESQADAKFHLDIPSTIADDLLRAIDRNKVQHITDEADLRWGAVFFGHSGQRLHSIYLNGRYLFGSGRKGYIDGTAVGLNRPLLDWFEKNYLPK